MKWSLRIVTILGTEVRIHATFALLLGLIAFESVYSGEGWAATLEAVLLVCTMFFCVLLHEFGHVLSARRYGILTPDITLLPIGGVARLERMPRKPSQELVVALCGPLVNVVIAALIALVVREWPHLPTDPRFMQPGQFWTTLMIWNTTMVFFNLIPAFPMDGGRVLRALLALFIQDYAKATRWAASLGQMLAVGVVLWMVFTAHLQPVLLLIAFFVFFTAGKEAAMVSEQEATRGLRVRDAMLTDFRTLPVSARLQQAVELLLAGSQQDFPLLDENGHVAGMLSRQALIRTLAEQGTDCSVMVAAEAQVLSTPPDLPLAEVMELFQPGGSPAVTVVDRYSGQLVGLLTAENVGEALLIRSALRSRHA